MIEAGLAVMGVALALLGLVAVFDMFVAPISTLAARVIVALLAFLCGIGSIVFAAGLLLKVVN